MASQGFRVTTTVASSMVLISWLFVQHVNASNQSWVQLDSKYGAYSLPVVGVKAQYYIDYGYQLSLMPNHRLPAIDFNLTPAEASILQCTG